MTTPGTRNLITCTGPDKPGLVAAISRVLADANADLEDLSMTRLSGNFAMLVLARGGNTDGLLPRLHAALAPLGLRVHLETAVEHGVEAEPNCFISAAGPNRTGIVAAISEVLARHNSNIIEMTTRLLDRTEIPVYLVRLEANVPETNLAPLQSDLEIAGAETGVEIRTEPIDSADF